MEALTRVSLPARARLATRKGNDYQGKGVHLATRIAALANGGEILASRSVAAHLGRLALSDFRTVRLKGLSEPVAWSRSIWQYTGVAARAAHRAHPAHSWEADVPTQPRTKPSWPEVDAGVDSEFALGGLPQDRPSAAKEFNQVVCD